MNRRIISISATLMAITAGIALYASSSRATGAVPKPIVIQDDMGAKAAEGANAFGLEMFRNLYGRTEGENLFISPPSLSLALGMTYGAAEGQTATDMAKVLHYSDALGAETGNAALLQDLKKTDDQVTVAIANALWVDQALTINPKFAALCVDGYQASVANLPQSDSAAADLINQWVSRSTTGMITQLVTPGNLRDSGAVLTNAVYFKGKWTYPFPKNRTKPGRFTPEQEKPYELPMMTQTGAFGYLGPEPTANGIAPEGMQAVQMPYGNQGEWAMYAFLPKQGQTLKEFVATLTPENWKMWRGEFSKRPVSVVLPRFKEEWGKSVVPSLRDMGMGSALAPGANFGGMFESSEKIYISDVIHKTVLKVTEEQTEAAAATAVVITRAAAPVRRAIPQVVFDRPFVCAIVHEKTGAVVFLGAFHKPTPNKD